MSKKMNFEEWAERESIVFTTYVHYARRSWNFCASQYENEVEELKAKFSEATKTYTDDIDRLEKETAELKKKLDAIIMENKNISESCDVATKRHNETMIHNVAQSQVIQSLESELEQLKKENLAMSNCENCFHFDVLNECNLNSISCIKLDKWRL